MVNLVLENQDTDLAKCGGVCAIPKGLVIDFRHDFSAHQDPDIEFQSGQLANFAKNGAAVGWAGLYI